MKGHHLPDSLEPHTKSTHEGIEIAIPPRKRRSPGWLVVSLLSTMLLIFSGNLFNLLRSPLAEPYWEGLVLLGVILFSGLTLGLAFVNMIVAYLVGFPARHTIEIGSDRVRVRKRRHGLASETSSASFGELTGFSVIDDLLVCDGSLEVPLGELSDEGRAALVDVLNRRVAAAGPKRDVPDHLAALRTRIPVAV